MKAKQLKKKGYSNPLKLIHQTNTGEMIYRSFNTIIVKLPENRNSLTISWVNGGYREDLEAIFNHQLNQEEIDALEDGDVPIFMKETAKNLGMDPEKVSGFLTVAYMDNVAIVTKSFRKIEVTAVVTAGIEKNGGRAGDPASYYEENGNYHFDIGTINTILIINSKLSESTLLRSVMTAVEAKTVVLQELMAPSKYSNGIATGSGTDNIAVISNLESQNILTNAGKHSKLGELIGKCVIEATSEALSKQSDLNAGSQRDMLVRLERFGFSEENYWQYLKTLDSPLSKDNLMKILHDFSKNPLVVSMLSSILHIVDEINWGLLPEIAGKKTAISMMKTLPTVLEIDKYPQFEDLFDYNDSIINNWVKISSWCMTWQK